MCYVRIKLMQSDKITITYIFLCKCDKIIQKLFPSSIQKVPFFRQIGEFGQNIFILILQFANFIIQFFLFLALIA